MIGKGTVAILIRPKESEDVVPVPVLLRRAGAGGTVRAVPGQRRHAHAREWCEEVGQFVTTASRQRERCARW